MRDGRGVGILIAVRSGVYGRREAFCGRSRWFEVEYFFAFFFVYRRF